MIATAITLLLILLLAIGLPVGFAMAVAGAAGLYSIGGLGFVAGILQTTPLSTIRSFELVTIPMFLLMAEFVLVSGIADKVFAAASAWFGRVRGGLGMATALAGAGFGAVCGSSMASAATLSATSLRAMLQHRYEPRLASGVVAVSGTLAMLIPPSVALIIYGLIAEVNIGQLLVAGIVPGILITLTIITTVAVLVRLDPSRAPAGTSVPLRARIAMLWSVLPMLMLFLLVSGLIYTGIATPTETSALGALGALAIAACSGKLTGRTLFLALRRAVRTSCMVGMILIGAHIFSYFFAMSQVTQNLIAWVSALDVPRSVVLLAIILGYLVLGTFLDTIGILVLTTPMVVPLIVSLGYDPIWFGIIVIVTAEVGLITPPVGMTCFVVAKYANRPIDEVFRGTLPHVVAHIVAIGIMVAIPQIVLWLPLQM